MFDALQKAQLQDICQSTCPETHNCPQSRFDCLISSLAICETAEECMNIDMFPVDERISFPT